MKNRQLFTPARRLPVLLLVVAAGAAAYCLLLVCLLHASSSERQHAADVASTAVDDSRSSSSSKGEASLRRRLPQQQRRRLFELPTPFEVRSEACRLEAARVSWTADGSEDATAATTIAPFLDPCPACPVATNTNNNDYCGQQCRQCCQGGASSLQIRWHGCPGTFSLASEKDQVVACGSGSSSTGAVNGINSGSALRFVDCQCYDSLLLHFLNRQNDTAVPNCTLTRTTTIEFDEMGEYGTHDLCVVSVVGSGSNETGDVLVDLSKPLPSIIGIDLARELLELGSETTTTTTSANHSTMTKMKTTKTSLLQTFFDTTCEPSVDRPYALPIFPGFGKFTNSCPNKAFIDLQSLGYPPLPDAIHHFTGTPPTPTFWFEFVTGTSVGFWPTTTATENTFFFDPTFSVCACREEKGSSSEMPTSAPSSSREVTTAEPTRSDPAVDPATNEPTMTRDQVMDDDDSMVGTDSPTPASSPVQTPFYNSNPSASPFRAPPGREQESAEPTGDQATDDDYYFTGLTSRPTNTNTVSPTSAPDQSPVYNNNPSAGPARGPPTSEQSSTGPTRDQATDDDSFTGVTAGPTTANKISPTSAPGRSPFLNNSPSASPAHAPLTSQQASAGPTTNHPSLSEEASTVPPFPLTQTPGIAPVTGQPQPSGSIFETPAPPSSSTEVPSTARPSEVQKSSGPTTPESIDPLPPPPGIVFETPAPQTSPSTVAPVTSQPHPPGPMFQTAAPQSSLSEAPSTERPTVVQKNSGPTTREPIGPLPPPPGIVFETLAPQTSPSTVAPATRETISPLAPPSGIVIQTQTPQTSPSTANPSGSVGTRAPESSPTEAPSNGPGRVTVRPTTTPATRKPIHPLTSPPGIVFETPEPQTSPSTKNPSVFGTHAPQSSPTESPSNGQESLTVRPTTATATREPITPLTPSPGIVFKTQTPQTSTSTPPTGIVFETPAPISREPPTPGIVIETVNPTDAPTVGPQKPPVPTVVQPKEPTAPVTEPSNEAPISGASDPPVHSLTPTALPVSSENTTDAPSGASAEPPSDSHTANPTVSPASLEPGEQISVRPSYPLDRGSSSAPPNNSKPPNSSPAASLFPTESPARFNGCTFAESPRCNTFALFNCRKRTGGSGVEGLCLFDEDWLDPGGRFLHGFPGKEITTALANSIVAMYEAGEISHQWIVSELQRHENTLMKLQQTNHNL